MKPPFTDADLEIWNRSIAHSPYRYGRCAHRHGVELSGNYLFNVKKKLSGWYVRHECGAPCTGCYNAAGPLPCRSFVDLKIPDNPTEHLWVSYPRHTSTQWRDGAALLPRTDGVYTCTISNNKELFKPRVIRDRCLVFTPEGDVLDLKLEHDGYGKESFKEKAGRIVPWFRDDRLGYGPSASWRGLYEVTGTSLTCSLTEIAASPYTYTGKLQGDATTLKLKWVNRKDKAKWEYTFRPVA